MTHEYKRLVQQTILAKARTINHNGPNLSPTYDSLAKRRVYFKQSMVGPSESNGTENYWYMWLFTPCFRRLRCRCYENLTTKFLKGHINCSWSKQSQVFFHIQNILFHPLKEQDRALLPTLFISQDVRKETLGIPLRNQLHCISHGSLPLPSPCLKQGRLSSAQLHNWNAVQRQQKVILIGIYITG